MPTAFSGLMFNFCLFSQGKSMFSKWFAGVPATVSQATVLSDSNSTEESTCRVPQHLQLPQVSIIDSAFLTSKGAVTEHREAAFGHLKLLCCPWGYHNSGWCVQWMKVCAEPLGLVVFSGKKGDRVAKIFTASSHFCHSSFWGLSSFLLPLNPVSVLKRAADSKHQSFSEICKN